MRLNTIAFAALIALMLTGTAFAQAALPSDDVNSANNPGSVKNEAQTRGETGNCTCRTAVPETTGTVNTPDHGSGMTR